jgi:phospholipid-binding lipoprotein MlaA
MNIRTKIAPVAALVCAAFLSACGTSENADVSRGIYDPYEENNRQTHRFNKNLDTYVVSPLSDGYGTIVPEPVRNGVSNFSDHLSVPNDVVNNVLQGDVGGAMHNTFRFAFNTVFGIAGIFDPATAIGVQRVDTDFGETLHKWGAAEGPYVEEPFFGPSTSRDTAGFVVDIVIDPFFILLRDPSRYVGGVAYVLNAFGDRYKFDSTIDALLYESADSYAQARSIYLQNRRFELGMTAEDLYLDPYDDPYAE